jgi:hypothetical protein
MSENPRAWPRFRSHKVVQAAPICHVGEMQGKLFVQVKPFDDHTVVSFEPTEPAMLKHAEVGGYAVLYEDGFKSISPKDIFEAGYTREPT